MKRTNTIINVPIEPIPMRYSVDWDLYFTSEFERFQSIGYYGNRAYYKTIYGESITEGIEQGKFLDIVGTNYYKSSQLQKIINLIHEGYIKDRDIIFFHDIWFPGIEQLAYIRDALGIGFSITGCLHAGSYDPNDFLYQTGMGRWGVHFEHCLFSCADSIYVATQYHADLLRKSRSIDDNKIKVTGFPIKYNITGYPICGEKEDIIVFPHRLDKEKHPELFDALQSEIDYNFVQTKPFEWVKTATLQNKGLYYDTLEKSKIAISFASQETWGIAMQEATLSGCIPIVPDRLSYPEIFFDEFRYDTVFEARDKVISFMNNGIDSDLLIEQQKFILKSGKEAIPNIIRDFISRMG